MRFKDFWETEEKVINKSYQKLLRRIEKASVIPASFKWWRATAIAASLALLLLAGYCWNILQHPHQLPAEIIYATSSPAQVTLPDGTKVWLSADTRLRYQEIFQGSSREVSLTGEAYFEVEHNPNLPFRVHTDKQTVEVLGTSFEVRAYDHEPDITTTVITGRVKVMHGLSDNIILDPGKRSLLSRASGSITVNDVNTEVLMAWKTGKYIFDNRTFEEIAHTLEKGFHVRIRIENEKLKNKPYTMRFENGESLEKILDLIRINAKYTYRYENGIIIIK